MTNKLGPKNILYCDKPVMAKELWKVLKPNKWPINLEELPVGTALVGGAIRDALLNRSKDIPDIDLIVPSNAIQLVLELAGKLGGTCVILDEKRDVARFVLDNWTIDFASQLGNSLEDDLRRRDFTINSIALTLCREPNVYDPNGGIQDLKDNQIVAISEKNLLDDPLRLLRCIRLIAESNFVLDNQTKHFLEVNSLQLENVAPERIKSELEKLVVAKWADDVIPLLRQIGLLSSWQEKSPDHFLKLITPQSLNNFTELELSSALPIARLTDLLSNKGLKNLCFSRKIIQSCKLLRKWKRLNDGLSFQTLKESDRFQLHEDLEADLPALILSLPLPAQSIWLERWRDPQDPLFHPSSPIDGHKLQSYLGVREGPFLGVLIRYLSLERAFGRLHNQQDALHLASYWCKQNQPLL